MEARLPREGICQVCGKILVDEPHWIDPENHPDGWHTRCKPWEQEEKFPFEFWWGFLGKLYGRLQGVEREVARELVRLGQDRVRWGDPSLAAEIQRRKKAFESRLRKAGRRMTP